MCASWNPDQVLQVTIDQHYFSRKEKKLRVSTQLDSISIS